MMILDIHTHGAAPQPHGVISLDVVGQEPDMCEGQLYSVGIHPWSTEGVSQEAEEALRRCAALPQVVAIGEAGIDPQRGAPQFRQMLWMRKQVELAEEEHKPLIIHEVKSHDIIVGLHRDLHPAMLWAIHGFRYKPSVAKMMTERGIYLSFGPQFNSETVASIPEELILAETDDSGEAISEVIAAISQVRGRDMTDIIAANAARFLAL